jgi:hypothetical protein
MVEEQVERLGGEYTRNLDGSFVCSVKEMGKLTLPPPILCIKDYLRVIVVWISERYTTILLERLQRVGVVCLEEGKEKDGWARIRVPITSCLLWSTVM